MNVLPLARRAEVFSHLMEGVGVRAASRLTGVSQPTILKLLLEIGAGYDRLHNRLVRDLSIEHIEADELHSYVGTREINLPEVHAPEIGEQWIFLASARTAKLVISYAVGKRDQATTDAFIADMRARLVTIPVLSTDAFQGYPRAVGVAFTGSGAGIDYAQVVKSFGRGRRGGYAKTSRKPGSPPFVTKRVIWGAPDLAECGTSRGERLNGSFRTQLRRLVRRGSGFSKKLAHHRASISTYVGFFNFCRIHMSLRVTPAMQVGITDHVWDAEEFIQACLTEPEGQAPSPQPLEPRAGAQGATRQTSTGVWLRAVPAVTSGSPGVGQGPTVVKVPTSKQESRTPTLRGTPRQLSLFDNDHDGDAE